MRLLVKHGADPLFVHHADYTTLSEQAGYDHRIEATTTLMAAAGMGGRVTGWVQPRRDEREALTLEAVKLAAELGVDVNAADPNGRTALDAAKALKYSSVVGFLLEKGAKEGTVKKTSAPPE
jgi:ankyrin repeat protein